MTATLHRRLHPGPRSTPLTAALAAAAVLAELVARLGADDDQPQTHAGGRMRSAGCLAAPAADIRARWLWGRRLLADPDAFTAGGTQLRPGRADELVRAARAAGLSLSETEIQRRLQCARTYSTEVQIAQAAAEFPHWKALCEAGFPPAGRDQLVMPPMRPDGRRDLAGLLSAALRRLAAGAALPARPACAGLAPGFDLEVDGETAEQRDTRLAGAVAVCRSCPVLAECRALAAAVGPHHVRGVWGGQVRGRPP